MNYESAKGELYLKVRAVLPTVLMDNINYGEQPGDS